MTYIISPTPVMAVTPPNDKLKIGAVDDVGDATKVGIWGLGAIEAREKGVERFDVDDNGAFTRSIGDGEALEMPTPPQTRTRTTYRKRVRVSSADRKKRTAARRASLQKRRADVLARRKSLQAGRVALQKKRADVLAKRARAKPGVRPVFAKPVRAKSGVRPAQQNIFVCFTADGRPARGMRPARVAGKTAGRVAGRRIALADRVRGARRTRETAPILPVAGTLAGSDAESANVFTEVAQTLKQDLVAPPQYMPVGTFKQDPGAYLSAGLVGVAVLTAILGK